MSEDLGIIAIHYSENSSKLPRFSNYNSFHLEVGGALGSPHQRVAICADTMLNKILK